MSRFVEIKHFESGYVSIPNLTSDDISPLVQAVIDEYEFDVYNMIFGKKIAYEMFLESPEIWALDLASDFAEVASYGIFAYWIRHQNAQLSSVGMVENQSNVAHRVSNNDKFVEAWNRFVTNAKRKLETHDLSIVPEKLWVNSSLEPINVYGI